MNIGALLGIKMGRILIVDPEAPSFSKRLRRYNVVAITAEGDGLRHIQEVHDYYPLLISGYPRVVVEMRERYPWDAIVYVGRRWRRIGILFVCDGFWQTDQIKARESASRTLSRSLGLLNIAGDVPALLERSGIEK